MGVGVGMCVEGEGGSSVRQNNYILRANANLWSTSPVVS